MMIRSQKRRSTIISLFLLFFHLILYSVAYLDLIIGVWLLLIMNEILSEHAYIFDDHIECVFERAE